MYDREYIKQYETTITNSTAMQTKLLSFLKATYQLLAGSLLAACVGSYIGLSIVSHLTGIMSWILLGIEILLIMFVIPKTKNIPGVNLAVLFVFTFITGLGIAPLLSSIIAMPNGASIVGQSFLMTSVAFGAISMFAMTTKKDYTFIGKFLFIALIIMVVAGISNIFIQSSLFQLAISSIGALIFSAFILFDTQNIIKGNIDSPIEAALCLYLDFLNLFISLLQILGIFNSGDKE